MSSIFRHVISRKIGERCDPSNFFSSAAVSGVVARPSPRLISQKIGHPLKFICSGAVLKLSPLIHSTSYMRVRHLSSGSEDSGDDKSPEVSEDVPSSSEERSEKSSQEPPAAVAANAITTRSDDAKTTNARDGSNRKFVLSVKRILSSLNSDLTTAKVGEYARDIVPSIAAATLVHLGSDLSTLDDTSARALLDSTYSMGWAVGKSVGKTVVKSAVKSVIRKKAGNRNGSGNEDVLSVDVDVMKLVKLMENAEFVLVVEKASLVKLKKEGSPPPKGGGSPPPKKEGPPPKGGGSPPPKKEEGGGGEKPKKRQQEGGGSPPSGGGGGGGDQSVGNGGGSEGGGGGWRRCWEVTCLIF